MTRPTARRLAAAAAGVAVLLAGCSYDATPVPKQDPPSSAGAPEPTQCDNDPATVVRSYAPDGVTAADARAELRNRNRVTVGISADSYLLGARNPLTGKFRGFDIDLAQRIASRLGVRIELRVISAADRIPMLQEQQIDLVVRNMTITCDRWEQIAFSAEYYRAGQKVLVRKNLAEDVPDGEQPYREPADLAGRTVCAPTGSTSIDNIREVAPDDATVVGAANHTGCLVKLQQGEVDAITGDDTVLAGLAAQDPYAVVPKDQEPFSVEPYGVGANEDDRDLVRFVNLVLEDMRSDGTWQENYDRWLAPHLGAGSAPTPTYGR